MHPPLLAHPSDALDALNTWAEGNIRLFAILFAMLGVRLVAQYLIPPSVKQRVVWQRVTVGLLIESVIATVIGVGIVFSTGPVILKLALLALWSLNEGPEIRRLARDPERTTPQPHHDGLETAPVKRVPDRYVQFVAVACVSVMMAAPIWDWPNWLFLSAALVGGVALLVDFDRYGFKKRPEPWD